jgi:hypothetical protein
MRCQGYVNYISPIINMSLDIQEDLEGVVKYCMKEFVPQTGSSNHLTVSLLDQSVDEVFQQLETSRSHISNYQVSPEREEKRQR